MPKLARWLSAIAATLMALAWNPLARGAPSSDPLAVVVGLKTQLTDITLATLRLAFRGEFAESGGGKRLIPFNLPQNMQEREVFDRVVLGLEPDEVGRFWIQRRIRDEGMPPRTLPSTTYSLRVVKALAGAITYLRVSQVTSSVRVLKIDGKPPGQPGYLFPSIH